jgi:hypothetical protein
MRFFDVHLMPWPYLPDDEYGPAGGADAAR